MDKDIVNRHACYGFSLIELLVAMVVSTLLLTMALPSFSYWINNKDVDNATKEFFTLLSLARNSALEKRKQVVVCGIDTYELNCVPFKWSGESDWSNGALVFIDNDKDERFSPSIDVVIKVSRFRQSGMSVKSSTGSFVAYKTSGYAQGFSNGTLTFSSHSSTSQLKITNVGRVRYVPQGT